MRSCKGASCRYAGRKDRPACRVTRPVLRARSKCEVQLEGEGSWKLPDGGDDMELIFTPGHTAGHVCLFYKAQKACPAPCDMIAVGLVVVFAPYLPVSFQQACEAKLAAHMKLLSAAFTRIFRPSYSGGVLLHGCVVLMAVCCWVDGTRSMCCILCT